jgi:L-2-hydroxyglutarate oxidase LhgO
VWHYFLQANGSLLLATTSEEVQQLEARAAMLQQQGVPGVVLLSPRELKMAEPALKLPAGSHGLLVKSDAQIVSHASAGDAAGRCHCKLV